jgi:hypothetical protein
VQDICQAAPAERASKSCACPHGTRVCTLYTQRCLATRSWGRIDQLKNHGMFLFVRKGQHSVPHGSTPTSGSLFAHKTKPKAACGCLMDAVRDLEIISWLSSHCTHLEPALSSRRAQHTVKQGGMLGGDKTVHAAADTEHVSPCRL